MVDSGSLGRRRDSFDGVVVYPDSVGAPFVLIRIGGVCCCLDVGGEGGIWTGWKAVELTYMSGRGGRLVVREGVSYVGLMVVRVLFWWSRRAVQCWSMIDRYLLVWGMWDRDRY